MAMSTQYTLTSVSPLLIENPNDFPFEGDAPQYDVIDYRDAGFDDAICTCAKFVTFRADIHNVRRKLLWTGDWSITGMGEAKQTCGEHLGLYSDGQVFTHTRRSCTLQRCPICGWKWELKRASDSFEYITSIFKLSGANYIRHATFNPCALITVVGGKLQAAVDVDGRVIPAGKPGDIKCFKLDTLKNFMERFHDASVAGPLCYAYTLHPGRETGNRTEKNEIEYYFSPHVHLLTNFTFKLEKDGTLPDEIRQYYIANGFTYSTFKNERTKSYNIDLEDYEDSSGRVRNNLRDKLAYNFSHALCDLSKKRRVITYGGNFGTRKFDVDKKKFKALVRSKNHKAMYKVEEISSVQTNTEIQIDYERENGYPKPERDGWGGLKWLFVTRYYYKAFPRGQRPPPQKYIPWHDQFPDSAAIGHMKNSVIGRKHYKKADDVPESPCQSALGEKLPTIKVVKIPECDDDQDFISASLGEISASEPDEGDDDYDIFLQEDLAEDIKNAFWLNMNKKQDDDDWNA